MKVYVGCSGWNYKDWRGKFYPEKLAQRKWLEYYSEVFNTVEVNNTFYRFPKDSTLVNWKETAPEDFNFTLKGSRYVTHMKKLKGVEESVEKFHASADLLEGKLSCLLWQLPPNLHRNDERLIEFCKSLKKGYKNIIEFRHISWFDEEVYRILEDHDISFCVISSPDFPEKMITTNDVAYIRFHGKGEHWYDYYYSKKELRAWHKKIIDSGVKEVYIYFNNDIHANAPENAKQMREMFDK